MSVKTQIDRLKSNVAGALAILEEKGVELPTGANSDDLAGLIASLGAETVLPPSVVEDYFRPGVLSLVESVKAVQTSDSITFIAMSDSHYPADTATAKSAVMANTAAKMLAYLLDLDFMAHMGDVSVGASATTPDALKEQIRGFNAMFREACGDLPCFIAIGNHDAGIYYHDAQTDGAVHTMTGDWLYKNFTAYSESEDTVVGGEEYGGYCYRDFESKKLRVFLLNTAEYIVYNQTDNATLGSQRLWLANALLELNSKSDASDWQYIILCHYPADYGATMPLSQLLKTYVEGGNITISLESGTSSTVSFSGKNSARFAGQFHGHVHNFIYDKLSVYENGSAVEYDAMRVCTPNGQVARENYYTTVGSYTDINFGEAKSYPKQEGTATGTSFVVNVIVPSEEMIYSFVYGAGINRSIGYGAVSYYSITQVLSGVSSSNSAVSVVEGEGFSTTITPEAGYDMNTLTVTMGGTDITNEVYADGVISIGTVTGNVVITAKATARANFTNLVPTSTDTDGTTIYGTNGYQTGVYLNSAGGIGTTSGSRYVVTGFMEVPTNVSSRVIRIAGEGVTFDGSDTYHRVAFYDENYNVLNYVFSLANNTASYGTEIEEDATVFTFNFTYSNFKTAKYIRVGVYTSTPENLIVTVDEEISCGGEEITEYSVTSNLTNVTSSNSAANVDAGGNYSATLTANDGYELSTVTVTMGGVDVTDSAYSDGSISISKVTGNIVITAIATVVQTSSYTNQIPLSTTTIGGTEIYNGVGYKTGTRINSSGSEVAVSNMCCTGFIPLDGASSKGTIIRIKNITVSGGATPYFVIYNQSGTISGSVTTSQLTSGGTGTNLSVTVTDGIIEITITANNFYAARLSCGVIDDTSIITVNEEITD